MFKADKLKDLEAKSEVWLNDPRAKTDVEHAQTVSGSEAKMMPNRAPSTLSAFGTTTSPTGRERVEKGVALTASFFDSLLVTSV
jgi:hypothetical protein